MRRIDVEKLKEAIQKNICEMSCDEPRGCSYCKASDVWDVICEQPTVDDESLITKHEDIGYEKGYRDGYAEALEVTDDTTPVVRCKECKHRIPNPHGYTCKRLFKEVSLDHYCSWGERREDEA